MPRISYTLKRGIGIWTAVSNDNEDTLTIRATPPLDGYLKLNNVAYRVKCGEISLSLKDIPDGTYTPRFDSEGEGFMLEKFQKTPSRIWMCETDDGVIRTLARAYLDNDERISKLEEEVHALTRKTEGHHIFN